MAEIADGETAEVQGSGKKPYQLKNIGGVYSCSCPAWRNQSLAIENRTCKHLRAYRGEAAEKERVGNALPPAKAAKASAKAGPPLLLAHRWENDVDLAGWWMSEKLDGVRAYWDGKQFLSRQGNTFHAPDWFVVGLPATPLDGELWLERKAFQRTVSVVRRQDKSDHWKQISFVIFDAPGTDAPFERRMQEVREIVADQKPPYASALEQVGCDGLDHLRQELARVENLGGEGLMLRQPGSRYESGRSTTLYKVKTFHDADATVVEHTPGKGRHKGRLGAVVAELPNGIRFSVGTGFSDAQRESPPAIGSIIIYRYQELSDGGVPRFPSFVGVRIDADSAG
ncbi:DNA ligase [Lignipirellula cremea]|uniref:DNA ligase n=1 Tax=Lignipirellula cremea TaxID=2528010 RepID=A0A518DYM3_9BACT|nr:DNA ligase [Lignipirellula cremea]QDU96901.1 DNA ligase [Lignipirellula cremea]